MSRTRLLASCCLLPLLLTCAAWADAATPPDAEALDAQFAAMDTAGWTGADASWSVRLLDGRTVWFFGDTFIGGVKPDGCRDRSTPVVHNSAVVQGPDGSMRTVVGGTLARPQALVPSAGPGTWYWPGPPILTAEGVAVPMALIARTGPGDWDVKAIGTALAVFAPEDLRLRSLRTLVTPPGVNMASAAVTTRRFTYVYGTRDYPDGHKDAYVARVPAGKLADAWQFWDGRGWTADAAAARAVVVGVSNQFSVIRTTRGWRLVSQVPMERNVLAFRGPSPAGPWTFDGTVARIPEIPGAISYNATVHPEFSGGGWWVLGFSVNGRRTDDVFGDADLYKPHFLAVRIP